VGRKQHVQGEAPKGQAVQLTWAQGWMSEVGMESAGAPIMEASMPIAAALGPYQRCQQGRGCERHTWTQGCISAVGMEPACATPLLMTHTVSAPNSSASCMYSYRPRPAGVNMGVAEVGERAHNLQRGAGVQAGGNAVLRRKL